MLGLRGRPPGLIYANHKEGPHSPSGPQPSDPMSPKAYVWEKRSKERRSNGSVQYLEIVPSFRVADRSSVEHILQRSCGAIWVRCGERLLERPIANGHKASTNYHFLVHHTSDRPSHPTRRNERGSVGEAHTKLMSGARVGVRRGLVVGVPLRNALLQP